jgi:hypothetical protein
MTDSPVRSSIQTSAVHCAIRGGRERVTAIYPALTRVEVYQEPVDMFGWLPNEYEAWLAATLKQQLL